MVLDVLAVLHPGPWPGDVGGVLFVQHLLRPHKTLTLLLDQVSTITWPIPALISMTAIAATLVYVRRWLDFLLTAAVTGLGSGSMYLTNQLIQRPRPSGYGVYVEQHIVSYFSFPSGHVQHVVTFFGFLLFLTYQSRRPGWWIWPLRLMRLLPLAVILLIGPSRMLAGEHWTSDVVQGALYGLFWLLTGIVLYRWAAPRWPRWLAPDERAALRIAGA